MLPRVALEEKAEAELGELAVLLEDLRTRDDRAEDEAELRELLRMPRVM